MNKIAALALLCLSSRHAQAVESRRYVHMQVYRNGSGNFTIMEGSLPVNMHVNAFGNSYSFSGTPISGHVSGSGNFFNISGGDVYGSLHRWGGNYNMDVTVASPGGGASRRLSFSLYASGRPNDPRNPPHFSIQDRNGNSNLNASPLAGGQGYSISGSVDAVSFGTAGTALAGLATAIALRNLGTTALMKPELPVPALPSARLKPLRFPL